MNRSVADTARILGVDGEQMKAWVWTFKDHLSGRANPGKGHPRTFTDSDVLALIYVCLRSECGEGVEDIQAGLEREDHFDDQYRDLLYAHTPISC
jgi:hypothetical protein